jgi:hypothetical protein
MKKSLMILCLCGALSTVCYAQNSAGGAGSMSGGGQIMVIAGHSVTLTWTASGSSGVTGYNVYRSQTSGGPYIQVNTSLVSATSYLDSSVTAGQTYYYVVTAVGQGSTESSYSNEASAAVPSS